MSHQIVTGFFLATLALLIAPLMPPAWSAPEGDAPLNFLLITVDDMNQDSVGVYGCEVPDITPNIDRLASRGMRFEHGHVTIAICQPTRAVWLTGRYPHNNGALGFEPIDEGVPTLPEALREAGYLTGVFAKVGHMLPSRADSAWDVSVEARDLAVGRDPALYHKHAKEFFEEAKAQGKPFFLAANAQDPHRPFAGSPQEERRKERHERRERQGRSTRPANYPEVTDPYQPDEVTVPGFLPDLPDVRREMAEYFTSVRRADRVTGAVLRALEEAGLEDNTLVMFLSDHGIALPFAKTNVYFHSTRTPWIIRWPGTVEPGTVDQTHMISGIDLTPTVLDALGIDPLEGMDGRSFVPILTGGEQDGRGLVFTQINRTAGEREYTMRSVQDREYGYIYNGWSDGETVFRNAVRSGWTWDAMQRAAKDDPAIAARVDLFLHRVPEELYDYENDPDARHNLIDDPAHRERAEKYRRIMLEQMKATGDPQLPAYEAFLAGR